MNCPKCNTEMEHYPDNDTFSCPSCHLIVDLSGIGPAAPTPPFVQPKELPMPAPAPVLVPDPTPAPSKVTQALQLARKVLPGVLAVLMALEGALTPGTVVHGIVKTVADVGRMVLGLFG